MKKSILIDLLFSDQVLNSLIGKLKILPIFMTTYYILKKMYAKVNYEEFGGCLLLGVKGITVIAHGRSKAYAIKNAVRVAKESVETGVTDKIAQYYE